MTTPQIISIAVFAVVMALVVSEKIHRALAALLARSLRAAFDRHADGLRP